MRAPLTSYLPLLDRLLRLTTMTFLPNRLGPERKDAHDGGARRKATEGERQTTE